MTNPVLRVKMRSKRARREALRCLLGILAIDFEVAIERPDKLTNAGLGLALLVGEGVELVNETFGMNPAQAMLADIELTSIVTDDHRAGQKAMPLDATPQGSLGGNHGGIGIDLETRMPSRSRCAVQAA